MNNEKTVLIVDDDSRLRRLYSGLIYSHGLIVLEAESAEEATEILMRLKIDLILLDINMPDINGKAMHEVIECFGTRAKVIVSSVLPVEKQKRFIPGAFDYHDKAQAMDSLLAKVWKALAEGSSEPVENKPSCSWL